MFKKFARRLLLCSSAVAMISVPAMAEDSVTSKMSGRVWFYGQIQKTDKQKDTTTTTGFNMQSHGRLSYSASVKKGEWTSTAAYTFETQPWHSQHKVRDRWIRLENDSFAVTLGRQAELDDWGGAWYETGENFDEGGEGDFDDMIVFSPKGLADGKLNLSVTFAATTDGWSGNETFSTDGFGGAGTANLNTTTFGFNTSYTVSDALSVKFNFSTTSGKGQADSAIEDYEKTLTRMFFNAVFKVNDDLNVYANYYSYDVKGKKYTAAVAAHVSDAGVATAATAASISDDKKSNGNGYTTIRAGANYFMGGGRGVTLYLGMNKFQDNEFNADGAKKGQEKNSFGLVYNHPIAGANVTVGYNTSLGRKNGVNMYSKGGDDDFDGDVSVIDATVQMGF